MTALANETIAVLRSLHEDLAAVVPDLSDDQLTGPSGASEWTLAQVLSHLGSGAEIGLATLRSAADGTPPPGNDLGPSVWARWDAKSPQQQAAAFLESDAALVEAFEAMGPEQRDGLLVDVGFLPAPLSLGGFAGMRLGEAAQHAWDVRVGLDPTATLDSEAAGVMCQHWSGELAPLLGFTGKADTLDEPARLQVGSTPWVLSIEDAVRLAPSSGASEAAEQATATFTGELEALARLVAGRLGPSYTPPGTEVTGNVTLNDLRRVFPGY